MEKQFKYKDVEINYSLQGEGYPVVLMHGWGCNLTTLASIEAPLASSFKVLNVDFPGFGKSSEPSDVWSVYDYADAMQALLKAEGIENPILLGHSFGGRVGIILASRIDVHKLLLVDAAGVKPKRSLKYYWKVYTYKTVKHLLPLLFGKKRGGELLDKYRGKAGSSDYNSASPRMRAIMSRVVNEDLTHLLPEIKAETLLIWGENDTATPISDARLMEKKIPNAGLVSFPNVGHYSFLENPVQFRAVLMSFLSNDIKK